MMVENSAAGRCRPSWAVSFSRVTEPIKSASVLDFSFPLIFAWWQLPAQMLWGECVPVPVRGMDRRRKVKWRLFHGWKWIIFANINYFSKTTCTSFCCSPRMYYSTLVTRGNERIPDHFDSRRYLGQGQLWLLSVITIIGSKNDSDHAKQCCLWSYEYTRSCEIGQWLCFSDHIINRRNNLLLE